MFRNTQIVVKFAGRKGIILRGAICPFVWFFRSSPLAPGKGNEQITPPKIPFVGCFVKRNVNRADPMTAFVQAAPRCSLCMARMNRQLS